MQKHSLLTDLIDIRAQIERDKNIDREFLKQRDREIGIAINTGSASARENNGPGKKFRDLRRWIAVMRQQQEPDQKSSERWPGEAAQYSVNLTLMLLWLIGLASGWILTQTVLAYDGSQPVNLISSLLVLVGLQLLSLLLLILFSLGGLNRVGQALSILNPAAMVTALISKLSAKNQRVLLSSLRQATPTGSATITRRLVVYLGQHFTIALNFGIIAALVYLVTISDIAFGWSTSLNLDNGTVFQWLHRLSLPWNSVLPAAAPTEQLVDASRHYRLQSQLRSSALNPGMLATWWLYLFAAVVVYGLLPRLVALIVFGMSYDREVSRNIVASPGASQILARMRAPLVSTNAVVPEPGVVHAAAPTMHQRQSNNTLPAPVIWWAFAPQSMATPAKSVLLAAGVEAQGIFAAGGNNSLDQDNAVVAEVTSLEPEGVAVVAKSWEPPVADFLDFLTALRQQLAANCPIIVLLAALPNEQVDATQLQTWEQSLWQLEDSSLYLEALK